MRCPQMNAFDPVDRAEIDYRQSQRRLAAAKDRLDTRAVKQAVAESRAALTVLIRAENEARG